VVDQRTTPRAHVRAGFATRARPRLKLSSNIANLMV
jgi:hypothetical protein